MTEADFIAAIRANPNDDSTRLIYADWLEEQGDLRGRLIRLQIELAQLPSHDSRRADLKSQIKNLLAEHEEGWVGPVRQWCSRWQFRRGLLEHVEITAPTLLVHADELFAQAPWLQRVTVSGTGGCTTVAQVRALMSLPQLASLSELDLGSNSIGDASVAVVARSPHLDNLRELNLAENNIGNAGVRALAASPHLAGLLHLDLTMNHIGDAGVRAIAASPNLGRLTNLDLSFNNVRNGGARALAASPYLTRLTSLSLWNNSVGDAGARAFASSSQLHQLTSLNLEENAIEEPGAEAVRARFGDRVQL